jgi:hypothetical protein
MLEYEIGGIMSKKKIILVCMLILHVSVFSWGKKITVLEKTLRPGKIVVNKDKLFVSDEYSIWIYNLSTLKLETNFGRKGKGPGELEIATPELKILNDSIFLNDSSKIMWFSYKGKLIKEVKKSVWDTLFPIKNNFLKLKLNFNMKTRKVKTEASILNKAQKKIKDLYTGELESMSIALTSDTGKEKKLMTPHFFNVLTDNDNIYVADSKKGFFIQVYDFAGNKINTINLDVKDIQVSSEYKKREIDKLKKQKDWDRMKKNDFIFYKNFPKIKDFYVNDGKIYVETYTIKNNKNEVIILNKKGKIIKTVFLPIDEVIYTFENNKFYYIKENKTTENWELFSLSI